jgi:hypothetical protein
LLDPRFEHAVHLLEAGLGLRQGGGSIRTSSLAPSWKSPLIRPMNGFHSG